MALAKYNEDIREKVDERYSLRYGRDSENKNTACETTYYICRNGIYYIDSSTLGLSH